MLDTPMGQKSRWCILFLPLEFHLKVPGLWITLVEWDDRLKILPGMGNHCFSLKKCEPNFINPKKMNYQIYPKPT